MIYENKFSECKYFDNYSNTCINRLNFRDEHFEETLKDLIEIGEFSSMVFDKKISYYWEMSLNSFVKDLNISKNQKNQLLKHIEEFKDNIVAKTILDRRK